MRKYQGGGYERDKVDAREGALVDDESYEILTIREFTTTRNADTFRGISRKIIATNTLEVFPPRRPPPVYTTKKR